MLQHNIDIIRTLKQNDYQITNKLDICQLQQKVKQMIVLYNF